MPDYSDTVLKECIETQDSMAWSQEPTDNQKTNEDEERTVYSSDCATEVSADDPVPTPSEEKLKQANRDGNRK